MTFDQSAPSTAVFSHPNHELAIFGLLQTCRPALVYLTDGGGEERVEQTRQGLRRIGLLDRAHFLNYTEKSFYDALLDGHWQFFAEVADRLRGVLKTTRPAQVLCDAVEFYNPVHDMSLPIVRAALAGISEASVFEVPLVYEKRAGSETYEVQRPADTGGTDIEFAIADAHVDAKIRARDEVYTILTAQMGDVITGIPRLHLMREHLMPAHATLPTPGPAMVLRYERRARILLDRGEIERMITYQGHYLPVATSLLEH